MSARPKSTIRPVRSALGAHNDNVPDSPSSLSTLSSAPSAAKIKIKCATTPEARTRVMVKSKAAAAAASRPRTMREAENDVWLSGANHASVLDSLEPAPELEANEQVLVSVR